MKKKILLLHGALGDESQMLPLAELLGKQFDVFSYTFQGHGKKAIEPIAFTLEDLAKELIDFTGSFISEELHVFGYSMGGYVALKAACDRPGMFQSITTLGTKFDWNQETVGQEIKFLNPDLILQKVPRFAEQLQQIHGLNWRSLLIATSEMMQQISKNPLLDAESIRGLDIPILMITGDADQTANPNYTRTFAASCGASFELLLNTPHPIQQVDLGVITQLIQRSIDRSNPA
jgi:pimeloyl-ACP methyl ester carboxylesterase